MPASARQVALRFLKIRPRSVAELKSKLETKGFEAKDIEATLEWLGQIQYLDDRAFTKPPVSPPQKENRRSLSEAAASLICGNGRYGDSSTATR